MDEQLENFRESFINDIEAASISNIESPEESFINEIKDILVDDQGNVSDIDPMYIEKNTTSPKYRNMRIDGTYLEGMVLTLLYCDYNAGSLETINNEFVRNKVALLEGFVYNSLKGYFNDTAESDPVTQFGRTIASKIDDIDRLQLIIISTNESGQRLNKHWDLADFEISNRKYKVDLLILDIAAIYEAKYTGDSRERINIVTSEYGLEKGIPCIKANVESDDYDSYLAVVPGKFLADIYLKYNSRILENNVRSFLNTRGGINKGIMATIKEEKSRFFAYNNGIATTADDLKIEYRDDGAYITEFDNLQIINGGQTTATLALAVSKYNEDLSRIYVQMKLSKIKDPDKGPEIVQLISKYANTQNKVTNADLSSNHPFFVRIENFSRKIKTPRKYNSTVQNIWFFERTRGQYDQLKLRCKTKADMNKFELEQPKGCKFTKSDLAKFINAADMKPYSVSWGSEVNLSRFYTDMDSQWTKDDSVFNEKYYQDLIAKAIMFKAIDNIVASEEWYMENRGYKAQIVPYTFSKFVYEISKQRDMIPDYATIWNTQSMIPEYETDIKRIAKIVFDTLYDPNREIANISEYAKRDKCWKKISDIPFTLTDGTLNHIVSKKDVADANRAARKDQKVTNGAASTIDIYNAGASYWQSVLSLNDRINVLNKTQTDLCQYAIDYINGKYYYMSDKQAKSLGEVMDIMREYNLTPNLE